MKLIRIFIALLLVTGAAQTFAKTSGTIEDRHLTGFHAVDVSGSFDVFITQGSTESVKVEAPDDLISKIITEVKGGELNIYTKNGFNWGNFFGGNHKKIAVYVTIKNCDAIALTGSGDVSFKEGITANTLRLSVTGSGDVSGVVNVKNLDSSVTGSGDLTVSGKTENSKVSVTGSGDYSGHRLMSVNCVVHVGGSGDASVNVSESLQASVTGSGDVHYTGSPKNISKSKSGSGDIERG